MTSDSKYHHGDLRSALLAAGAELLEASGIEAVTIRALSERAGVSHAAPYRHFPDRRSILSAIACDGFRRLDRKLTEAVAPEPFGAESAFGALITAYLEFAVSNPSHYRLMFGREVLIGDGSDELRQSARAALNRSVAIVEECQETGAIRSGNPLDLANTAWATVHGLASLLMNGLIESAGEGGTIHSLLSEPGARDIKELIDFTQSVVAALLRGLAPDNTDGFPDCPDARQA